MEYIHILPHKHWESALCRFSSLAFKPSDTDGGISVIDMECAIGSSGAVCAHLRNQYPGIAGEPPIFWKMPQNFLPNTASFVSSPSTGGDPCHSNITGLSEKVARRLFKKFF